MESSPENVPPQNLATALLLKRKMAAKNADQSDVKLARPPPVVTRSHTNEKLTYRQNLPVENPIETTTTAPTDTTDPPKISRKTKQLEVTLLDKKMEEINRKQDEKTTATIETWKGFDSLNYGFIPASGTQNPPVVPPVSAKQPAPTSLPKIEPTPKRVDSQVKHQPRANSTLKEENLRKETPIRPKSIEKQPSSSPIPPSQRPKINSTPSIDKAKTPEQEQPKPPTPLAEKVTPMPSITSNSQIFEKNVQSPEQSSLSTPTGQSFKLFPDIKQTKNAYKSIQRSMDRYRFHIW